VLIGAVFCAVFVAFLRKLGLSKTASALALLSLCALPINGLRNEGQMVPFIQLLLFVFADYYALHAILIFLSIMFYQHLKYDICRIDKKEILCWLGIFLFSTAISMGGQRCLQMVILPMTAVELVELFIESEYFSKRLDRRRYIAVGFVGSLLVSGLVGGMRKGQAQYSMYLNTAKEVMERIFITVPAAILEGFGIDGNARVGTFQSLMQMLIWAFLILTGFAFVYIYVIDKKHKAEGEKQSEPDKKRIMQREALAVLLTSLGITAFIVAFTTAEAAHNYFMFAWFAAVVAVAVLTDRMRERKSLFAYIIMAAVCVFAVLNLKYTYADAVTTTDNLKEYEEVADYMISEGIEYGYAEFWDAERISLVRDGAVTFGCSYTMSDLHMYWWITSMKWYTPSLPEDMRTAYVVRQEQRESFLAQFTDGEEMEPGFENDKFVVFVSDKNYVSR
jgi:hypothetical protein